MRARSDDRSACTASVAPLQDGRFYNDGFRPCAMIKQLEEPRLLPSVKNGTAEVKNNDSVSRQASRARLIETGGSRSDHAIPTQKDDSSRYRLVCAPPFSRVYWRTG